MFNKISKLHRYLILLVAALMVTVYFVPLWYVDLTAPQYPEGLAMYIWVDKVTGGSKHDIENINLLNHYIGMKPIMEDSIPELQFMPYVLAYMIFGAFVAFLWPKRVMIWLGIVNLFLVALAGLYDFWRWEFDYGHNLDPEAPIVVPGMTYQPPLLFCKSLLNITACSWPFIGAVFLLGGLGILVYILWKEHKADAGATV